MPEEGHDYRHLTRPQCDILIDENGELVADIVLRFEHLLEDVAMLSARIGRPLPLEHINRTHHRGFAEFKTQAQIDRVGEMFECDVEYFGYAFSDTTPGPSFFQQDFSKLHGRREDFFFPSLQDDSVQIDFFRDEPRDAA